MTDTAASRDKLWTMIKDIKFAMFTTRHGSNGHLHSRPMTTQNKELGADDSLWFFMSRRGDPVADLLQPLPYTAMQQAGRPTPTSRWFRYGSSTPTTGT